MGIEVPSATTNPSTGSDAYTVPCGTLSDIIYDMHSPGRHCAGPRDAIFPTLQRGFTHPYNSDIDFVTYRNFYAPGSLPLSPWITPEHSTVRRSVRIVAS